MINTEVKTKSFKYFILIIILSYFEQQNLLIKHKRL